MDEHAHISLVPVTNLDPTHEMASILACKDNDINPFEAFVRLKPRAAGCFSYEFNDKVHGHQHITCQFNGGLPWSNITVWYTRSTLPLSLLEDRSFVLSFRTQPTQTETIYEEYKADEIPVVNSEDNSAQTLVIAGSAFGVEGVVQTDPPVLAVDVRLKQVHHTPSTYDLLLAEHYDTGLIHVWEFPSSERSSACTVTSDGNTQQLSGDSVAIVRPFRGHVKLRLLDHIESCRVLIIAGKRVNDT
ncbi:hypothetical protein CSKR_203076 [Clonorchis sinensis]|uniref:Uncharacterized protein n=1 Tax=Clonorchis sinensis TaxID=79923 RepID=A0A8T1M748_CLOSI|nr:hypothetical protein CSKR_203076 [Clonorchis sinensis]